MAGGRLFGGLGPDAPPGSGAPEGTALRLHGALDDARRSSGWDFGFSGFSMDIYIYIWSPWDKNMDISMENVGTGYFMDISRNNLGFPRKFPWTFQAKK